MMIYKQNTGELFTENGELIHTCYSGHGQGKNNPTYENIKNVGPIPKGIYLIIGVHDSENTGPFTIILHPDESNEMYGRGDFRIHGDSKSNPGTASHGCIIAPRNIRESIYHSNDKIIKVI